MPELGIGVALDFLLYGLRRAFFCARWVWQFDSRKSLIKGTARQRIDLERTHEGVMVAEDTAGAGHAKPDEDPHKLGLLPQ